MFMQVAEISERRRGKCKNVTTFRDDGVLTFLMENCVKVS
jgi:hypothetical protein